MEISQKLLGLLFAASAATGAGLGILGSALHLLRALILAALGISVPSGAPSQMRPEEQEPTGSRGGAAPGRRTLAGILLFWPDLSFGLACALSLILLLYFVNDGQFRLMAVLGMGCGGLAWACLPGRLIDRLTDCIVSALFRLIRLTLHLLAVPPVRLYRFLDAHVGAPLRRRSERKRLAKAALKPDERVRAAASGFGLPAPDGPGEDAADGTPEQRQADNRRRERTRPP